MAQIWAYVTGVLVEGIVVGIAFWVITYITLESSSFAAAVRAGIISEVVGNLTYLAGLGPMEPPSILMTLVGGALFVRIVLRAGELTPLQAVASLTMTYFFMVALVACAPV
jgi:hypothetical protein